MSVCPVGGGLGGAGGSFPRHATMHTLKRSRGNRQKQPYLPAHIICLFEPVQIFLFKGILPFQIREAIGPGGRSGADTGSHLNKGVPDQIDSLGGRSLNCKSRKREEDNMCTREFSSGTKDVRGGS